GMALQACDWYDWAVGEPAKVVPGTFCSQLVVEVMNRMGLKLFDEQLEAHQVSPSRIATSPYLKTIGRASGYADPQAETLPDDEPIVQKRPVRGGVGGGPRRRA